MGVADATGFDFGGSEADPPELPDLGSLLMEADPFPVPETPSLSEHMIIAAPTDPPTADVEIAVGRPLPWQEARPGAATVATFAEPTVGVCSTELGSVAVGSAVAVLTGPDDEAAEDDSGTDRSDSSADRSGSSPSPGSRRQSSSSPRDPSDPDTGDVEPNAGSSAEPTARPAAGAASAMQALEALLFAAHEPLAPSRLGSLIGDLDGKAVRKLVEQLNAEYDRSGRTFRIEEIAGGFQLLTRPEFHGWLKKLFRSRAEGKLSQTAMLTLAIIAYKQPIKRVDIESIRGTACGEVIRTLMEKGLVKIVGREESLGRPLLYGTTKKFLQAFGLGGLKDLPKVEELNKP